MDSQKPNKGVKMLKLKEKTRIIARAEEGVPVKEIATRMGCHRSAVHQMVAKAKGLPKFAIPDCKKVSGRPWKLTSHVLGVVRRHIQKNPGSTAADLNTSCPELGQHLRVDHLLCAAEEPERSLSKDEEEKTPVCQKHKAQASVAD
jgi:transposase